MNPSLNRPDVVGSVDCMRLPVNSDRSFAGNCRSFAEYRVSACTIALKIPPSTMITTC
jgi:hypothetical protein